MLPVRAIRLQRQDSTTVDRMSFEEGEVIYDASNGLLRLMDGNVLGGKKIANQVWVTSAISTAITSANNTLTTAVNLRAPIASPTFTGTVTSPAFSGPLTGNVTGNVTGNLTGNLTGDIYTADGKRVLDNGTNYANPVFIGDIYASDTTSLVLNNGTNGTDATFSGNSASATKLVTARNINGVSFNGTASISVSTLVNGAQTVTLNNTGELTVPGDITANIGTVTAFAVTTTNDVTVGGNANISTVPTLPTHATNKKYVDGRAIAIAVALS